MHCMFVRYRWSQTLQYIPTAISMRHSRSRPTYSFLCRGPEKMLESRFKVSKAFSKSSILNSWNVFELKLKYFVKVLFVINFCWPIYLKTALFFRVLTIHHEFRRFLYYENTCREIFDLLSTSIVSRKLGSLFSSAGELVYKYLRRFLRKRSSSKLKICYYCSWRSSNYFPLTSRR